MLNFHHQLYVLIYTITKEQERPKTQVQTLKHFQKPAYIKIVNKQLLHLTQDYHTISAIFFQYFINKTLNIFR